MRTYVKFTTNDEYRGWQKGDYGIVDGYVCQNGITYAIVIIEKSNRFEMARPFQMEFVKYIEP